MFTKDLTKGSWGGEVPALQKALKTLRLGDFSVTGLYGAKTKASVTTFQKAFGIDPIGVFGPITRAKMNSLMPFNNGTILYTASTTFIGVDASPNDLYSDEYACAESVWDVIDYAFPGRVGFDFTPSTHYLNEYLNKCQLYVAVPLDQIKAGDIYISPTGEGNGTIKNGHVGIYDGKGFIMSNNSANGFFDRHLSVQAWHDRYVVHGGYPIYAYRRI